MTTPRPASTSDRSDRIFKFQWLPAFAGGILCVLGLLVSPSASAQTELAFSIGQRTSDAGDETEFFVRGRGTQGWGGLAWVYGAAVTDESAVWIGAGLERRFALGPHWSIAASVMPGLRARGGGPDLGHTVQFRSGLEIGRDVGAWRGSIGVDHLSNAGLDDVNPGSNALFLRFSRSF